MSSSSGRPENEGKVMVLRRLELGEGDMGVRWTLHLAVHAMLHVPVPSACGSRVPGKSNPKKSGAYLSIPASGR